MSKKLAATVHVDGKVYKAGETVDADIAKRITNPKAWGSDDKSATASTSDATPDGDADGGSTPDGDAGGTDYSSMTKAELEKVAEERGVEVEGRNKPDYIAALQAADAS